MLRDGAMMDAQLPVLLDLEKTLAHVGGIMSANLVAGVPVRYSSSSLYSTQRLMLV